MIHIEVERMKFIWIYLLLLCVLGLGACGDEDGIDKSDLDPISVKEVELEFRLDGPLYLDASHNLYCLRHHLDEYYTEVCDEYYTLNTRTRITKLYLYVQETGFYSYDKSYTLLDRVELPLDFTINPQYKHPSIRGLTYQMTQSNERRVFSFVITKITIEGEVEVIDDGPSVLNPVRSMDNFEIEGRTLPWVYEYNACRSAPNCASGWGKREYTSLNPFEHPNPKIAIHFSLADWLQVSFDNIIYQTIQLGHYKLSDHILLDVDWFLQDTYSTIENNSIYKNLFNTV